MTGETIINIPPETQFELKLQEFDKKIAIAELNVADLKKQKAEFIYDSNVQMIISLASREKSQDLSKKIAKAEVQNQETKPSIAKAEVPEMKSEPLQENTEKGQQN